MSRQYRGYFYVDGEDPLGEDDEEEPEDEYFPDPFEVKDQDQE